MSVKIFDYLIKNNNLERKFQSYSLYEEHYNFIKDLISGEQKNPSDPKSYLFEIIANKKSGLDIDKYDYLMRDSYFFGIRVDADFHRYLMCLVVWEDENKIKHLAFRDKSKSDIENIFHERLKMHYIAYQHRVCIAINAMLVDALQAADEHYKVQGSDRKYKLSECHEDEEAMLKLTDSILENLYFSSDSNLAKAKKVILRIYKRQLYELCGKVKIRGPLSIGEQEDLLNVLSEIEKNISKTFNVTFRCCLKKLDLGQTGNTRPVDNIIFMSKSGKKSDQTLISEGIDLSPKQPGPLIIGLIDMKTIKDHSKFQEIKTVFETTIKKFNI